MPIEHGIRVPTAGTPQETGEFAKRVEDLGFDFLWIPDTPLLAGLWRDVYLHLQAAAMTTTKLRLGPGVTNPITREPLSTANAIVTLDDASAGRADLIAATGYSSAYILGKKAAKLQQMRDAFQLWRGLFAGERVDLGGLEIELGPNYKHIPLIMAASAPKALALAAEIADAVVIMVGSAPGVVKWALEKVDTGLAKAGQTRADIKLILVQTACLDPDRARARDLLRPNVAGMGLGRRADGLFALAGLPAPEVPADFNEPYPDMIHAVDWDAAMESSRYVSDEAVETMMLVGEPDEVAERVQGLVDLGFDAIWWRDTYTWTRPEDLIGPLAAEVIPRLK